MGHWSDALQAADEALALDEEEGLEGVEGVRMEQNGGELQVSSLYRPRS